jgi:hypothetical protein
LVVIEAAAGSCWEGRRWRWGWGAREYLSGARISSVSQSHRDLVSFHAAAANGRVLE